MPSVGGAQIAKVAESLRHLSSEVAALPVFRTGDGTDFATCTWLCSFLSLLSPGNMELRA
jgi:hypothetical protein